MTKFLAGAALAVFAVTGANAAIITQTWTGTVNRGTDTLNFFGGGVMDGKAFTATYVYNDALSSFTTPLPGYLSLTGAIVSASLTLNGVTYSLPSFGYNEAGSAQESNFTSASSYARGVGLIYLSNTISQSGVAGYGNLLTNFSGDVSSANSVGSTFNFGNGASGQITLKNATYTISTVAAPGAVPEPATWAMMIGGFGAVGGAMRYRRRKATVSFA